MIVKEKRKLKKSIKIVLIIFSILLLGVIGIITTYQILLMPISSNSKIINFEVEKGSTVYGIANKLKKENLIRSILAYKIYVKLHSINDLKYGSFSLSKNMSTKNIIKVLSKYGKSKDIVITFYEGKNMRQIAKIIEGKTNNSSEDVIKLVTDKQYITSLMKKYWFLDDVVLNKNIYYPLEGYLFPNTYNFANKDVSINTILETMLSQTEVILDKYKTDIKSNKYSVHEILTLASVVEMEGVTLEDRKSIASVFLNRLNIGMPLGSCATTYYAAKVDMSERDLYLREINMNNPYNTRSNNMSYKLPIGPICNPSENSIKAVLYPNTTNYYYFVSDKNRKTYFAKTYNEHTRIINDLQKSGNWYEW
ncbi:MAG TPA: endolytic transglycosylase MltG [Bacilli bacterium]|nr:endolytic transglycosylase MltG [Bacilli bacterium]